MSIVAGIIRMLSGSITNNKICHGAHVMGMSVLSDRPDGCGYYYGFLPGDCRRIDVGVSEEDANIWNIYIAGEHIGLARSFDEAEERAVEYLRKNPEPIECES